MSLRLALAAAAACLVLLLATRAAADPPSEEHTDEAEASTCALWPPGECFLRVGSFSTTDGGTRLPPGMFMDTLTWERLEAETKRLQEAETRLKAERDSYKESAKPPLIWVGVALATGIAVGWGVSKL